jgi:hypothetical protein
MKKTIRRLTLLAAFALCLPLRADQVVMQNGDVFNGTVLSVSTNALVLQDENLGKVTLLRAKVTNIVLGTVSARTTSPTVPRPALSPTNAMTDSTPGFQGLRDQTNLIQQVEAQFLAPAGPAAVNKFNELLDGLSTGKIDMNDLRAQAQSAAEQLRSLKKDMGPDQSAEMDSYLAILDDFLQETAPANPAANAATNSVSSSTNAQPATSPAAP